MKKNAKTRPTLPEAAVRAYNDRKENFDPSGSYTGNCRDGKPVQDADDL